MHDRRQFKNSCGGKIKQTNITADRYIAIVKSQT